MGCVSSLCRWIRATKIETEAAGTGQRGSRPLSLRQLGQRQRSAAASGLVGRGYAGAAFPGLRCSMRSRVMWDGSSPIVCSGGWGVSRSLKSRARDQFLPAASTKDTATVPSSHEGRVSAR